MDLSGADRRAARVHRALVLAQARLEQLAIQGGADVGDAVTDVGGRTAADTAKIIASQLPAVAGDKATLFDTQRRARETELPPRKPLPSLRRSRS